MQKIFPALKNSIKCCLQQHNNFKILSYLSCICVEKFCKIKCRRGVMNGKKQNKTNGTFGIKLKELRKAKGLTQQALAEKANIDDKHLCRIENGKYFPTYATLNKLLKALGTTLEETGLELENVKINENPIMAKALQILNSAKDDEELKCYLEVLKTTQRALEINKA